MNSMPILDSTCAADRIAAAATGNSNAQTGQETSTILPRRDSMMTARTMPTVPSPVCQVSTSPSTRIPRTRPNSGEVEDKVEDRVGPR